MKRPFWQPALAAALALAAAPVTAQSYLLEQDIGFPDFGYMEAPGTYKGPVFALSDSFPATLPDLDPEVVDILKMDFENNPLDYVMAVRDYVFKGNIHGGPVADDFILQNNSEGRAWYHVPWQHWGTTGREGYHGLTREGPLASKVLAPEQDQSSYAYAVGFYNGPGGFTIGQVWPSVNGGPDLSYMIEAMDKGQAFPEGTVVGKFLFTALGADQVPWLANPLQWQAYIYNCDIGGAPACGDMTTAPRSAQPMNLLQMDVMVKDSRATEAAGWVFGTFTYDGNAASSKAHGEKYAAACAGIEGPGKNWCNLMPVGVMWGNDPDNAETFINSTPTETVINANLTETWINDDPAMPAMHLGFNSRLNGPADNPTSSCMSCHATGQVASISAIMPWLNSPKVAIPENGTQASAEWMRWFRNFRDGEAFDEGQAVSMDFSMQLTKSIENYIEYRGQTQQGRYALEYWSNDGNGPISRGAITPTN